MNKFKYIIKQDRTPVQKAFQEVKKAAKRPPLYIIICSIALIFAALFYFKVDRIKISKTSYDTIPVYDTLHFKETIRVMVYDTVKIENGQIVAETLKVINIERKYLPALWKLYDQTQPENSKVAWYQFWITAERFYPDILNDSGGVWRFDDDRTLHPRFVKINK